MKSNVAAQARKDRRRAFPDIPAPLGVPLVDNHTHIYPDPDGEQRLNDAGQWRPPLLLENLRAGMAQAGIRAAITSGCDYPILEWTAQLARDYPEFWAALAIHPNEAPLHAGVREIGPDGMEPRTLAHHEVPLDEAIAEVARLSAGEEVVAVGETGLDYFRTAQAGKQAQVAAFRAHIALAKELNKPLQIHDRDAHRDVIDVLKAYCAPERTVFHCFSADAEIAAVLAENGWYASFAGPVTYPANTDLLAAATQMPAELILLETDAPYLTPAPYRGHPNAVWGVSYTAQFISAARGSDIESFCLQVDKNVRNVYGI